MKRRRPSAAFKVFGSGKQERSSGWRSGSDAVNSTSSLGYSQNSQLNQFQLWICALNVKKTQGTELPPPT